MKTYIPDQLYQSSRPGYGHDPVSKEEVSQWIYNVHAKGIKTIICLLTEDQLNYYSHLSTGLLGLYQENGFEVIHIPIMDPAHDEKGWAELVNNYSRIFSEYEKAEKPVLIHCSAGMDRSPRAADYILNQVKEIK